MTRLTRCAGSALLVGGILLLAVGDAEAQCRVGELSRLHVPRPAAVQLFAASIAADADVAVIGCWADSAQANCSGAAWVFRRQGATWVREQELRAAQGVEFDYFGAAVAVSGGVIVVGAPGEDGHGDSSGAAYIYRFTGTSWDLSVKLAGGVEGAEFGGAVGVSGDAVVIGAWGDTVSGVACGSASVYRWNGSKWNAETLLAPADGATDDWFGAALAISGDTVVIGAPYDDDSGEKSGSAYIFQREGATWVQKTKLCSSGAAAGDWFGEAVAVQGDVAVIGAPYRAADSGLSGAAYIFRRTGAGWIFERKLLAPDGAGHDFFGYSVAVEGNIAVVGTILDGDRGQSAGSAYVFARRGADWNGEAKLLASHGAAYEFVGESVALCGGTALVGASATADGAEDVKFAYVFNGLSDCNGSGSLDICDLAAGTSVDANGNGVPDECDTQRGDLNCDGHVTFADINPFVLALQGYERYHAAYPNCDWMRADCNNDGAVDAIDIGPFVRLLNRW